MMRDCEDGNMRDMLPDYVRGTLAAKARATVAAHLAACGDCAAEAALIEAAARAYPAPRVDIARIVKSLPQAPRAAHRPFFSTRAGQLAAAVGIMAIGAFSVLAIRGWFGGSTYDVEVGGRALASNDTARSRRAVTVDSPAVAATTVAAAAATSSARSSAVPKASAAAGISFGGGLSDLTDDQLDTLLGELDGLDSLPSTEPETHLSPIVPPADGGHSAR